MKFGSDELIVLRALLARADSLAAVIETSPETAAELVGYDAITPDLLRRALQMAVNVVEKVHDLPADEVSLYIQANVMSAKEYGYQSHRDVIAAVHYSTRAARQTIITKARRLADRLPAFKAQWAELAGKPGRKRKDCGEMSADLPKRGWWP